MAAAQVPRALVPRLRAPGLFALALLLAGVPCGCARERALFWPDGEPRAQGAVDWAGRREGEWTFHYPDGSLRERGTYRNGRKSGTWTLWYRGGVMHSQGERRWDEQAGACAREGPWTLWFQNGQLRAQGRYEGGRPAGPWKWWNHLGEPDTGRSGVYADGERVGPLAD